VGNELIALGGAFLAAGLLARAGRRLGLPTIPLFMLAGILLGPNTPGIELVEHPGDLQLLATLGLVLLLFHLGLEFSLGHLAEGGKTLLASGATYLLFNLGAGLSVGIALGWGTSEALVVAGAIGISSSAIVTKLLVELRRLQRPETRLILGIIVVEDLFLALYLAVLQPVLTGATGLEALRQLLLAFGFLVALVALARWGTPLMDRLVGTNDDELLTILFLGVAILTAGVAEHLGVSDAIGAFLAGLILAETAAAPRIARLVLPLRDAFAAVFFFAFGLSLDPGDVGGVLPAALIAVFVSVVVNLLAGALAARIGGFDRVAAAGIGLTVLSRGEFSLILASLAVAAGLDERLAPFVGVYVMILALLGPLLAARSDHLTFLVPGRLVPGRQAPSAT
jgi:CPA2 family monovalent cation:H+ antiporter-2